VHSFIACSRHLHTGSILRAYPVGGELRIQRRSDRQVAAQASCNPFINALSFVVRLAFAGFDENALTVFETCSFYK